VKIQSLFIQQLSKVLTKRHVISPASQPAGRPALRNVTWHRRVLNGMMTMMIWWLWWLWVHYITTLQVRYTSHVHSRRLCQMYSVSQKNQPLRPAGFWHFFHKRLKIVKQFFTLLLYVLIYARLLIFIQLSPTLTKLCHIKRDYLVHIICSKCPPSAETHAFRRSCMCTCKSLTALLIVVCGKSL